MAKGAYMQSSSVQKARQVEDEHAIPEIMSSEDDPRLRQIETFSLQDSPPSKPQDGWMSTVGMFDDDPLMKEILEEAQAIRKAQRSG